MTNNFTYIELFAGIGGFRQALDQIGGQCVFASEIDKFAVKSYEALYGHAPAGDITKIAAQDIPDHDVIVAGVPCQAFSVAGHRRGFEDTRGTLFFDVARIAKEKRPKAVWIENVKGLVGHDKGRTLDAIVQTLNEIGYHVDFNVLNSKYFGVPQNRERIFIVALRDDLVKPSAWQPEGNGVVAKGKRRIGAYDGVKTFNFDWPAQESVTTRLRDVLEPAVDERYYLSEEKTAKLVAQLENGLAIREATKQGYAIAEEGDAVNFQFPDSKTRRGRVGKQIANTLEASGINQGVVTKKSDGIEWAGDLKTQTTAYPRDYSDVYGVMGVDGVCQTLRTMQGGGREPKIAEEQAQTPRYRIRKLTPLECWRLQNFPDEAFETVKAAGLSDSQLYKQAGNSITVSVVKEIGKKLLEMEVL